MQVKEPSIIIKPIGRLGGLDNLHVTLLIVIALLFALVLVTSYSKPILITNSTNSTTNQTSIHSQAQIKLLAEKVLASYANVNSSLSLLPYITNTSSMSLTYLPESKSWYVRMNARNFGSSVTSTLAFIISDTNTSNIVPLIQEPKPSQILNNTVVAQGVIKLGGKYACLTQNPMQVYWFIDPYAVGSVRSLLNATAIERKQGSNVNLTMKIISSTDTQSVASQFGGLANAQYLGKYILCASHQSNFNNFVTNLESFYSNTYVPQSVLSNIANSSNLDRAQLALCVNSSQSVLNSDVLLSQYYNITQTPVAVLDCHYMALPQTAEQALCYVNKSLC